MSRSIVKEKAFAYSLRLIRVFSPFSLKQNDVIANQLLRCGTSVGANINEALDSESLADFIHKMTVALKECSESIYWLELMYESGKNETIVIQELILQGKEIRSILRSIIITSKAKLKH